MFCTKCGSPVKDTSKFCKNCGAPLTQMPTVSQENVEVKKEIPVNNFTPEVKNEPVIAPEIKNEPVITPEIKAEPIAAPEEKPNFAPIENPAQKQVENKFEDITQKFEPINVQTPINVPVNNVQMPQYNNVPMQPQKAKNGKKTFVIVISIILALLIAAGGVFAYMYFTNKDDSNDDGTSQGYPNPDENGDGEGEDEDEDEIKVNPIDEEIIEAIIEDYSDYTDVGIYVKNLKTGYEYEYNANKQFPASAMAQVVILNSVSNTLKDLELDCDDEDMYFNYIPNGKEAPDSKDDDMSYVSITECLEDVAVYGDNNKSNQLVDYIADKYDVDNGFDIINNLLEENGHTNTKINRKIFTNSSLIDHNAEPNMTSAKEIATIYGQLIKESEFGTENYMKSIFKSISSNGDSIGLKKYIPEEYAICSANAMNDQCSNDVAIISNGDTEILISILCCTEEDKTDEENYEERERIQKKIIEHVLETQFAEEEENEEVEERKERYEDIVIDEESIAREVEKEFKNNGIGKVTDESFGGFNGKVNIGRIFN